MTVYGLLKMCFERIKVELSFLTYTYALKNKPEFNLYNLLSAYSKLEAVLT